MYQISASRRLDHRAVSAGAWLSLACASVLLVVARWLSPDPAGLGTHVQLGLPPCVFWVLTGWPCPTCGLTTAFAHMARFSLGAAQDAHALGPWLFALTVLAIPSAALVIGSRSVRFCLSSMRGARHAARLVALTLTAALLLAWLARLARA